MLNYLAKKIARQGFVPLNIRIQVIMRPIPHILMLSFQIQMDDKGQCKTYVQFMLKQSVQQMCPTYSLQMYLHETQGFNQSS